MFRDCPDPHDATNVVTGEPTDPVRANLVVPAQLDVAHGGPRAASMATSSTSPEPTDVEDRNCPSDVRHDPLENVIAQAPKVPSKWK